MVSPSIVYSYTRWTKHRSVAEVKLPEAPCDLRKHANGRINSENVNMPSHIEKTRALIKVMKLDAARRKFELLTHIMREERERK